MEYANITTERHTSMDTDNMSFICGLTMGLLAGIGIWIISHTIADRMENDGYSDKLVVIYHSPDKEYDRKMAFDMVNSSGIQTNFINKEVSMDKHTIKWRLTNPR